MASNVVPANRSDIGPKKEQFNAPSSNSAGEVPASLLHLCPAEAAVALGRHSLVIHAKRVPVNPEGSVADAARDAELIPSCLRAIVPTWDEHQRGTSWRDP